MIFLDRTLNPGLRADALRYEILHKYGGIYVDADMALVKPIQTLLQRFSSADLFLGISYSEAFEVNNAIIGSIPQHPLIKLAID
jgi:mannosyltransferase OCH1-like enzyme